MFAINVAELRRHLDEAGRREKLAQFGRILKYRSDLAFPMTVEPTEAPAPHPVHDSKQCFEESGWKRKAVGEKRKRAVSPRASHAEDVADRITRNLNRLSARISRIVRRTSDGIIISCRNDTDLRK